MVYIKGWEYINVLPNINALTLDLGPMGCGVIAHPEGMLLFYFMENDVLPNGRVNLAEFRHQEIGYPGPV